MTIREAIAGAASELGRAGVDTPQLDAELLLAAVLETNRTYLLTHPDRRLSEEELRRFHLFRDWRAARMPLPYLTGMREFYGRQFRVDQRVLIPRPETETLVEAALAAARGLPAPPLILDVGTGSGCVAITLALEIPGARVIALDLSAEALEVAGRNAELLGASGVELRRACFPDGVDDLQCSLDLLVSNPPYVSREEADLLPPEVAEYEPPEALYATEGGFGVIQALVQGARRLLKPGGLLAFEVGHAQAAEAVRRAVRAGLQEVECRRDLNGTERVVTARAPRSC